MTIISLGKINRKIFIPLFGGLLRIAYKFCMNLSSKTELLYNNPFLMSIYTAIGMALSFIPYLILISQIKKRSINNSNISPTKTKKTKLALKLQHYDIYKETKWKRIKLILLATLFDCLQVLCGYIFCWNCVYNLWIFDIIFINLFSNLILKTRIYKHQYFSMIIIIIFGLGLNIIEYFKKNEEDENKVKLIEIIAKFISEIFYCINVVINKLNMEKYFCNTYEICIWEGLIDLIIIITTLSIVNKIGVTIAGIYHPDNLIEYLKQFNMEDAFLALLSIVINGVYNILIIATCDFFTPCHVLIILIINECYEYFKFKENLILNLLGLLILILIFFMFLFFVEILEFNVCEFSINTKKNIEIRSDSDASTRIINYNSHEDEESSFE